MADRPVLAERLLAEAWNSGVRLSKLGELRPCSRREAYAAQEAMAAALGLRSAGWKVGAATPAIMAATNLDAPIPGPVYESRAYASPASLPTRELRFSNLETEFAFRMTERRLPRQMPGDATEAAGAVVACAAFDLSQSRFSEPPDTLSEIADSGNSGGPVLGPQIPGWREIDLTAAGVTLRLDGEPAVMTYFGGWRRDPFDVLIWFLNDLGGRGIGLAEGSFVLTGSVTEPQPLLPETCGSAFFEGTGAVHACVGGRQ